MTEPQVAWPNIRRSIYDMAGSLADSSTKCFINHMGMSFFEPDYISNQYKRAADLIVDAKVNGLDQLHADGLFMPVGFLYRHALELKLKGLLDKILHCDLIKNSKGIHGHNIVKLWDQIRPVIINHWPKADHSPLDNVESLLKEFDLMDKTGQNFRYSKTTSGQDVRINFPKVVRLELLKEAFDELYSLLDGLSMEFDSMLQWMNEMRTEREY